ncbi:MAG TPA: alpha/beta fold hydrolase [Candidatus Limnocylindria bacterium]|jgi:pyruvate dehydrogenase E2 component (dihydrolipoamide acetyltransferase)|nr:alpha/beta fold hydrolase [Candidatus Limnocylindria bacterium]
MQVRVASCDRYRLRVTSWGRGAPPHAVVLPGLSADWRALAPQIRTLRRLGWTVHVVDLPGFALHPSLRAADATVVQLADYVARVIEELSIPRALVLGHSLGGGVALHLALRRPELVSGLVLIAPAALGLSLHWIYKLYCVPLLGRALLRPSVLSASSIRRFLVGSGRRSDSRFVARLVRHGASCRPRALSARAIVWANQPRRWDKARAFLPGGEQLGIRIDGRLAELSKVPTLVLWGDEDRVISAADARRCKQLPLAEVQIARGVGHSLPLEAAGWANEHIARFIASLTATQARAA